MKADAEDTGHADRQKLASAVLAAEKTFDEARTEAIAAAETIGSEPGVPDRSDKAAAAFEKWKSAADAVTAAVSALVLFNDPKADVKNTKVSFFPDMPAILASASAAAADGKKAREACAKAK